MHLYHLSQLQNVVIPEQLLGTFVENAFTELARFGRIANPEIIEKFITPPYVDKIKGVSYQLFKWRVEANLVFVSQ